MPSSGKEENERRQYVREKAGEGNIVVNSPYGTSRGQYGWGNLFGAPMRATVPGYPNIHIGLSSLNAVPAKGDRAMSGLMEQYRRKFNSLEHCYTYHKVSELPAWESWASMVEDSNTLVNQTSTKDMKSSNHHIPNHPTDADEPLLTNPYRFIYTIKANNFLTHHSKLEMSEVVERHIDSFFGERCAALHPFLGPILLQLPPYFHRSVVNMQRLEQLNARLPHKKVHLTVQNNNTKNGHHNIERKLIRIAVEFRHDSWLHNDVFDLLRKLGWALVVTHELDNDKFSTHIDTHVPFMYVRLHGAVGTHVGDYGPVELGKWANMIKTFVTAHHARERNTSSHDDINEVPEVYFFFNNNDSHVGGATSSVVDATYLAHHLQEILPKHDHHNEAPEVMPLSQNSAASSTSSVESLDSSQAKLPNKRSRRSSKVSKNSKSKSKSNSSSRAGSVHASQVIDVDDEDDDDQNNGDDDIKYEKKNSKVKVEHVGKKVKNESSATKVKEEQ